MIDWRVNVGSSSSVRVRARLASSSCPAMAKADVRPRQPRRKARVLQDGLTEQTDGLASRST
jgi:hypothetical protein